MKKLFLALFPTARWRMVAAILGGMLVGLVLLVLHISRAGSYLSERPETCINCHVMFPHYATWRHSSHRQWATCSDCHVPHDHPVRKWYFKASDGLRHAAVFTARAEPQVIRIEKAGETVVQENCIRCHIRLLETTRLVTTTAHGARAGEDRLCWDCHREVPHGAVSSLASTPFALVPRLSPVVPEWMQRNPKR